MFIKKIRFDSSTDDDDGDGDDTKTRTTRVKCPFCSKCFKVNNTTECPEPNAMKDSGAASPVFNYVSKSVDEVAQPQFAFASSPAVGESVDVKSGAFSVPKPESSSSVSAVVAAATNSVASSAPSQPASGNPNSAFPFGSLNNNDKMNFVDIMLNTIIRHLHLPSQYLVSSLCLVNSLFQPHRALYLDLHLQSQRRIPSNFQSNRIQPTHRTLHHFRLRAVWVQVKGGASHWALLVTCLTEE